MKSTTETIPTALNRHVFIYRGFNGDEPPIEIASYGDTVEEAAEHISGGPSRCEFVRTEPLPYTHANLVAEICEHLPGHWFARPDSNEHPACGWKITSGNLSLHISPPCYNHKNAFHVSLYAGRSKGQHYVEIYDENRNRVSYPSINVGASKSPEQMAKDIARRLIPEASRVNDLVLAKIASEERAENSRLETLKHVCAALECPIPREYHSQEPRFVGHAGEIEFSVSYGGTVSIKLDCTPLQLNKIVQAMKNKD